MRIMTVMFDMRVALLNTYNFTGMSLLQNVVAILT